tara:strand:- start:462 stop:677 length:216 start_codon:yes stop_codon:yes gene_type:complete
MQCTTCSTPIEEENDLKRQLCFKCHVKGIRFGFVSVGYGQSEWNNSTIRETQRMYEAMPNVEKVSTRQELI